MALNNPDDAYTWPQSIIDGLATPILVIDAGCRVRLMNRAAREFFSAGVNVANAMLCYQISHRRQTPCEGMAHPCPLEQVSASGQPVVVVHEHYGPDGEQSIVELRAAPLLGADGSFQGIVETFRSIIQRQWRQSELEKLRKAVETAGEVIFMTDREGVITYINPEFTRLYGYSAQDVVGKKTPRVLKSGMMTPRDYEQFWETLLGKQVVKGEIINRCSDGSLVTVEGSANPVLDERGDIVGFLAIQRDISARKQAQETLQQYADRLRALTAQLAEVAEYERQRLARELHDRVGQNLTALSINLNIVRSQMSEEESAALRSRLEDSLTLVERMTERIRDVMANLRPPVLDDYGLVAALRWYGERFASRTGFVVVVVGEELVPRLAARVENALFRIAQEALTNVVKHAQAAQVTVKVEVNGAILRLVIADDGIGFEPSRLFEPNENRGWGLLTMTERAEAVGGRCRVESDPGKGTHVIVEIAR